MRIGHGYDVHRLKEGRKLILGGVSIPFSMGLDGVSDADVLIHAIIDALLGAAALPDIGSLFPPSDPAYRDIDSTVLLRRAADELEGLGYGITNIDCTVIAERPRLSPYILSIRENLSSVLNIPMEDISVKATTTEGLGFEGEGLGISAHAVAIIHAVNK